MKIEFLSVDWRQLIFGFKLVNVEQHFFLERLLSWRYNLGYVVQIALINPAKVAIGCKVS